MSAGWQIAIATFILISSKTDGVRASLENQHSLALFNYLAGWVAFVWLGIVLNRVVK